MKYLKLFEDYLDLFKDNSSFMTMDDYIEKHGDIPGHLNRTEYWEVDEIKYLLNFFEKLKNRYNALFISPYIPNYKDKYTHIELEIIIDKNPIYKYLLNVRKASAEYFMIRLTSKSYSGKDSGDVYYVCEDIEGVFSFILDLLKRNDIKLYEEVRFINKEPIKYKYSGTNIFDKPTIVREEEPLMDKDKIRVYHGFNSYTDVKEILKMGLSGKDRAKRIYSYEYGNNPSGLFVSIDLDKIKKDFSYSGVIIEFTTKVSDLEDPVWVGGRSYFVQGEYTKSFKDLDEREQQRLINREKEGKNEFSFISKSDRPELAQTIFENPERQALYIGDLNPNMIKYIWYKEPYDSEKRGEERNWRSYTRKDFINYINKGQKDKNIKRDKIDTKLEDYKFYYPNDEFTIEDFMKRVESKETEKDKRRLPNGRFQAYLKHYLDDENCNEYELRQFGFFPKQIKEIMRLRKEGAFKKFINKEELKHFNDN